MTEKSKKEYLLIGIGGIGMSAMALLLKESGCNVSGFDHFSSPYLESLKQKGIDVLKREEDICWEKIKEVIFSTAVDMGNPLLQTAREKGIPLLRRGEKLACLMNAARFPIAVTGTHGKTTTSALLSHLFIKSRMLSQMYIGGISKNYGTNYILEDGDYFIAEVDESDKTFEKVCAKTALITNIEYEHVDRYSSFQELLASFAKFINGIRDDGKIFYKDDDNYVPDLVKGANIEPVIISRKSLKNASLRFEWNRDSRRGKILLSDKTVFDINNFCLTGWHNMENAALAVACAWQSGISSEDIQMGLDTFKGIKRRFEIISSEKAKVSFITDYAHHPTEIRQTLSAARSVCRDKKLCVVFQPHRISRLEFFFEEFADSLKEADFIVVTEVYLAGETGDPYRVSRKLVDSLSGEAGCKAWFSECKDLHTVIKRLIDKTEMVLFLGAGSIDAEARILAGQYGKN